MNVHAFMNELSQKEYWYPRKIKVKIYLQSQSRVVLLWYHIFWQSSIQRGRHTQLCIITSLKRIIQICSNFYCWVSKIAHPIHIVWGNVPFKVLAAILEAILKIPFDLFVFLGFSMSFMMYILYTQKSKNNHSHFLGNGMYFAILTYTCTYPYSAFWMPWWVYRSPIENFTGLSVFLDPENHDVDTNITVVRCIIKELWAF